MLIEGLDLSGKTTVCKTLLARLSSQGLIARWNTNTLANGPLDWLLELSHSGERRVPDFLVTTADCLVPYYDALFFRRARTEDILIQESYLDRSLAYLAANNRTVFYKLLSGAKCCQVQFDLAVHLTASNESRRDRFQRRAKNKPGDEAIISRPELREAMEHQLLQLITKYPEHLVIDTTDRSVEEVSEIIVRRIANLRDTARS